MGDTELPDAPDEDGPHGSDDPHDGERLQDDEADGESEDLTAETASEALGKVLRNRRAKGSGGEKEELTPEEQEEIRKSVERLRRAMKPLENVQLPRIAIPPDVLKNVMEATHLYKQVAKSLLPAINSDWFKSVGLLQAQMQPAFLQLTKNVDFGLGAYAKLIDGVRTHQADWLKNISETLIALRSTRFYPSNLEGIAALQWEEVEAVVMLDGISLFGVPRRSIAEALIRATSAASRREILGRRSKAISQDCRIAVEECETEAVKRYASAAIAALDAFDAGHTQAAQALAGSLIDGMLRGYFGKDRAKYTPDKKGNRTTQAFEVLNLREFVAFAPMWQAYQQFWVDDGDTVPTTFNRNATAHTVSARQFTRRNAIQALLFACGVICFLNERARYLEA